MGSTGHWPVPPGDPQGGITYAAEVHIRDVSGVLFARLIRSLIPKE